MEAARVFVQPLAAYNEGKAGGRWVDVSSDPDEFLEDIQKVLKKSPVKGEEEWGFHDFDGILSDFGLGEYENYETLSQIVELAEEYDPGALAAYYDYVKPDIDDLGRSFEEAYQGQYDDEEAYAWQYLEDTGTLDRIPKDLRLYFNVEAYARDLFINDLFSVRDGEGGIYVFQNL